jgi:ribosome-binding protein aMBF1 (putative translation factor)
MPSAQLADHIGIADERVRAFENGDAFPIASEFVALEKVLGVHLAP